MKKFIIIAIALVAVLSLCGAGYAKHQSDVKHDRAVAAAKAEKARIKAAYEQDVREWKSDHQKWEADRDDYRRCKISTADTFDAIDHLNGVTMAGTNYDGYSDALEDVGAAIGGLSRNFDPNCMSITLNLDNSHTQYAKAAEDWMDWYNDLSDTRDLEDLDLQSYWDKAGRSLGRATRALNRLRLTIGAEPMKPTPPGA